MNYNLLIAVLFMAAATTLAFLYPVDEPNFQSSYNLLILTTVLLSAVFFISSLNV